MLTAGYYLIQRVTALLMVPLVLGHLATMIYAVQGGLSADEILSRTQGSLFWGAFYGLFVVASALHAAIGLRVIIHETVKFSGVILEVLTWVLMLLFAGLGLRAVYAVVF